MRGYGGKDGCRIMEGMPELAALHWSGGKDSMLALHQVISFRKYEVRYLLTSLNETSGSVSIHGVSGELLSEQVKQLDMTLHEVRMPEIPGMAFYEQKMEEHIDGLQKEGITCHIFGDIFLEDLRRYREQLFNRAGVEVFFPLWKQNGRKLIREFVDLGYQAIIVAAREDLKDLCGRIIDHEFITELPDGVDPCGENGEFHTFVFDGPLFQSKVAFETGELIFKTFPESTHNHPERISGYWYIDLKKSIRPL
ncbi:hypothetical protein D9M68_716100 [compost metagenome]